MNKVCHHLQASLTQLCFRMYAYNGTAPELLNDSCCKETSYCVHPSTCIYVTCIQRCTQKKCLYTHTRMHIACMQKSALTKSVPLQWTKGVLIHPWWSSWGLILSENVRMLSLHYLRQISQVYLEQWAPAEPDFAIECLTEIAAHIIGCIWMSIYLD